MGKLYQKREFMASKIWLFYVKKQLIGYGIITIMMKYKIQDSQVQLILSSNIQHKDMLNAFVFEVTVKGVDIHYMLNDRLIGNVHVPIVDKTILMTMIKQKVMRVEDDDVVFIAINRRLVSKDVLFAKEVLGE